MKAKLCLWNVYEEYICISSSNVATYAYNSVRELKHHRRRCCRLDMCTVYCETVSTTESTNSLPTEYVIFFSWSKIFVFFLIVCFAIRTYGRFCFPIFHRIRSYLVRNTQFSVYILDGNRSRVAHIHMWFFLKRFDYAQIRWYFILYELWSWLVSIMKVISFTRIVLTIHFEEFSFKFTTPSIFSQSVEHKILCWDTKTNFGCCCFLLLASR